MDLLNINGLELILAPSIEHDSHETLTIISSTSCEVQLMKRLGSEFEKPSTQLSSPVWMGHPLTGGTSCSVITETTVGNNGTVI